MKPIIQNSHEKTKQKQQAREAASFYTTTKGERINYKSLLGKGFEGDDYRAGNQEIWERINHPTDRFDRLTQLKDGEWASIENKYTETGMFEFSVHGNGKIRSPDDVAFIFRSLESQSIENAFAVYLNKKKHPFVQWISMGGISSTVIDRRLFVDAAIRFDAEEIYFVHNHPSGNLSASNADHEIFKKLKEAFTPFQIQVHGVIINLASGKYSLFDEYPGILDVRGTFNDDQPEQKLPVFSFSKRAFLSSPLEEPYKIRNSKDVAKFLSQQRFGSGEKRGYLLLDTEHKIIGNFFATKKGINDSLTEASVLASRHGATSLIAYTNNGEQDITFFKDLKNKLQNLDFNLLDVVQIDRSQFVEEVYTNYTSLADEGILNESRTGYHPSKGRYSPSERAKIMDIEYPYKARKIKMEDISTFTISQSNEYTMDNGKAFINESREANKTREKVTYDIGFGSMGNGTAVWNKNQIENNDYKTIAHISNNGQVYFYEKNLPEYVKKRIRKIANRATPIKQKQIYQSKTTTIMEQKNLDYLANQIKYLGFGEDQKENLKNLIELGEQKFSLTIKQQYDGSPINYTLHFSRSNESDMIFLNAYDAEMADGRRQSVYLDKGKGFTAKETFNLMQGRAVFKELRNKKEGTTFNAWINLSEPEDGKNLNDSRKMHLYNENYGYDVEKELAKHPIIDLNNEDAKEKLISSLKKGNRQAVTFKNKDGEERKFVEASPKWKCIEIYNKDGKKMFIPQDQKKDTVYQANVKPVEKVSPSETKTASKKR